MKSIGLIIVNWNAKAVIGRCVESLLEHFYKYKPEIIVVDNNSSDGSLDYLKNNYPMVKLIPCTKNYGFAVANNMAVRVCDAELIFFVNPDTELIWGADLLVEHLARIDTAVCFGQLRYPNGKHQDFIRNFPTLFNQIGEILFLPKIFPTNHKFCEMIRTKDSVFYANSKFIQAGSGAFFGIKKKIFLEAGMFDQDYFVYGEETDLFYKLNQKGHKIFYDPKIKIIHHHGKSTTQNPSMYKMLQNNKLLFIKKNYGLLSSILYRYFLFFLYDINRGVLCFVLSVFDKNSRKSDLYQKAKNHFNSAWNIFFNIKGRL
jgi:N-acetylglucosaminyl-diphospho-decaprenol L-rhamnosyltransferase